MQVVDIHLLLADHVRFEMMRRLGWLRNLPCGRYSLVELVQQFEAVTASSAESAGTADTTRSMEPTASWPVGIKVFIRKDAARRHRGLQETAGE
jgi:hypothetical protein